MAIDLDLITDDDVGSHLDNGNTPMIGVDITHSALEGLPLNQAPQGVCGIQKWMEAQLSAQYNSPISVKIRMEFLSDGSTWEIIVNDEVNNTVIKSYGAKRITGKAISDTGFANTHEQLGYIALRKLARAIAAQIDL
jgi:hypothetical protein